MRQELQTFYEKTAAENGRTITKQVSKGPINVLKTSSGPGLIPGSGQRVAWGAQNKVTGFTKGSSPREFGNKMRHDQMRNEALGTPPPPNPSRSRCSAASSFGRYGASGGAYARTMPKRER